MIEMKGFRVLVQTKADALLGYTGENLSRRMTIVVDEVGTWSYKLDLEFENGQKNILDLTAGDGVLYVDIERAHLAQDGSVRAQVRAMRGDEVRKSNVFLLRVMSSVDAVEYFEPLPPSEFEQMEARITALKAEVERLAASADESARGAAEALSEALESASAALSAARSAEADAESAARAAGISEEAKTAAQAASDAAEEALTQSRLAVQAVENALAAATSAEAGAVDAANRAEAYAQGIAAALKAAEDARDAAQTAAQSAEDALKQLQPTVEQALCGIRSEGDTQVQRVSDEGAAQIKEATRQAEIASEAAGNAAGSEQRAGDAASRAVTAAIRQPYPSAETGTWWCWDVEAGAYVDSGIKAKADELHVASPDVLGGVQPEAKTDTMTIPVGVDAGGKLYAGKDHDVDQLKSDLSANAASDKQTAEKLDALWKLNQGISYDFVTDSEEAYEKVVPAGCKYAAVESIGGNTEVINSSLVSADVESIKCDGVIMANVPDAVRSLPGYGWSAGDVCNSIERTEGGWQYVQRVSGIDLGTLPWSYHASSKGFICPVRYLPNVKAFAKCVCTKYNIKNSATTAIGSGYIGSVNIAIYEDAYSDAAAFRAAMDGVLLYYEMIAPAVTDITDLMGKDLDLFAVEPGGALTFENAAKLPVPNTVQYIRSIKEVNA